MNRGDAENDASELIVGKANGALAHGGFIEETEFAVRNLGGPEESSLRIEIVIIGEAVFGRDF